MNLKKRLTRMHKEAQTRNIALMEHRYYSHAVMGQIVALELLIENLDYGFIKEENSIEFLKHEITRTDKQIALEENDQLVEMEYAEKAIYELILTNLITGKDTL